MTNKEMLYELLYALTACNGREAALFGASNKQAREAFSRSLAGDYFPQLWFELPLAGEPWFDLHAVAYPDDLKADALFAPETCGNCPSAFTWFAAQEHGARQLILSWDTSASTLNDPAIQFLTGVRDTSVTCGFLEAAGRADATSAYRSFVKRLPKGWFACYTGVFPQRKVPFLRVECIPPTTLQRTYATDADLLKAHLAQMGFAAIGDTLLTRCQALAGTPFQIEFQFDVTPNGTAGSTLGVSLRFAQPPGDKSWPSFDIHGAAGALMRQVEDWGLADERWRLLQDTIFSKRLTMGPESAHLWCFPAFIKLRWKDGAPLDAKAYLVAGVQ